MCIKPRLRLINFQYKAPSVNLMYLNLLTTVVGMSLYNYLLRSGRLLRFTE